MGYLIPIVVLCEGVDSICGLKSAKRSNFSCRRLVRSMGISFSRKTEEVRILLLGKVYLRLLCVR